jgi:Fur family transcriptional regulator, peroxide stress response regulator
MINIEAYLEKHNMQPYLNRVMIFEYVLNHDHPTVDEIFRGVREKNKQLSKMTVYNVLDVFLEAGIVREVTIDDKQSSYDIKIEDHGHFKCKNCNKVFDFDVDMESIDVENLPNCIIEKKDIFFYGVCDKCKADMECD